MYSRETLGQGGKADQRSSSSVAVIAQREVKTVGHYAVGHSAHLKPCILCPGFARLPTQASGHASLPRDYSDRYIRILCKVSNRRELHELTASTHGNRRIRSKWANKVKSSESWGKFTFTPSTWTANEMRTSALRSDLQGR